MEASAKRQAKLKREGVEDCLNVRSLLIVMILASLNIVLALKRQRMKLR
jgi:hypothetical protein